MSPAPSNAPPREKEGVLDVAIIGAGFSGICMGIKLRAGGISNFRIFEKSRGVSGTWWDNTYPGAACDVPSHLYCFSFELNPSWSRVFSPQVEIQDYVRHCVAKYGIAAHIQLQTEIHRAVFNEKTGCWRLTDGMGKTTDARCVVSGVGGLSEPNIPDIPGLNNFEGTWFHSARWKHHHTLKDKRVAVIGSAASAIQIVPQIAPNVEKLYLFQRTANYIVPRNDRAYTDQEKKRFKQYPFLMRLLRWKIFWRLNMNFSLFRQKSWMGLWASKQSLKDMRRKIDDATLQDKLTPRYPIGCKRILLSDDFYPALNRGNVHLITDGIRTITQDGIRLRNGETRKVDTIILATGFRPFDFFHLLDFEGLAGRRLSDVWRGSLEALRGVSVTGFPNLFFLLGPNTALGHNSIIFMIEQQVSYIVQCIKGLGKNTYIDAKPSAMQRYNARIQSALANTVWAADCPSWYKTSDGKIPTLWPYNTVRYWRWMRTPDLSEFNSVSIPDTCSADL